MNRVRKHAKTRILIDYPAPNESMSGSAYTFRIKTLDPGCVEIAIDGGDWRLCREAVGYWWFDWNCAPGEHALSARLVQDDGTILSTGPRRFKVGSPARAPVEKS